jgi:hypothetical protein
MDMNLCDNNHDEVCYEGRHCPACAVADDLNKDISRLEDKIIDLENQIKDLEEARE